MANRDIWQGRWKQVSGKIKEAWGDITDDELKQVQGDREQLIGKIQEKSGQKRADIERRIDEWLR